MIKTMALLTKRPDLSLAEFDAHWHRPHGDPLTLAISIVRHAVQNSRLAAADDLIDAPYHGIPEVWLDDPGSALALQDDPAYAEADADQVHFMDIPKLRFLITAESAVDGSDGPGEATGVKLVRLLRADEGLSGDDFDRRFADSADRDRGRAVGALRHVRSRSIPESYVDGAQPEFDAARELWFPDLEALRAAPEKDADGWRELITPSCADSARSVTFIAAERRLR
ncbi:EthD domain-containing protein [Saccharopolyspora sp. SCSIO 74807]|uniref:EthD domain-containing protein n=1 Tax=Saccharopolyspora sp. SCSIO 74807 TaxID=3118084 RepID=UPI0030D1668F